MGFFSMLCLIIMSLYIGYIVGKEKEKHNTWKNTFIAIYKY